MQDNLFFFFKKIKMQDNWPSILFAMSGGVFNGLGTLATQYGWAFVGLSVTEVMASSLKVVIGTKKFRVICSPDNKNDA